MEPRCRSQPWDENTSGSKPRPRDHTRGDGREGILGCMPRDESVPLSKTLLLVAYLFRPLGSLQDFILPAALLGKQLPVSPPVIATTSWIDLDIFGQHVCAEVEMRGMEKILEREILYRREASSGHSRK
ncbi:hypothetical protein KC340_g108 [Hortaea werneckii]|nr:hypothetical protein KC340_g108 [Hortaea werneckii]